MAPVGDALAGHGAGNLLKNGQIIKMGLMYVRNVANFRVFCEYYKGTILSKQFVVDAVK